MDGYGWYDGCRYWKKVKSNFLGYPIPTDQQLKDFVDKGDFMFVVVYKGQYDIDHNPLQGVLCGPSGISKINKAIDLAIAGNQIQIDIGEDYGNYVPVTLCQLYYMRDEYLKTYGNTETRDWIYDHSFLI